MGSPWSGGHGTKPSGAENLLAFGCSTRSNKFAAFSVFCRLDYGNAVMVGLPVYLVRRPQSVLNAASRLIYHMRSADYITDALVSLHWLRVPQRIEYKIAVLTYKALHGSAPRYLGPLVPVADLPGRRALRSAPAPVACRCVLSDFPLSVAGPSRLPVHESGTLCRRRRRQPSRCLCSVSV